MRKRLKLRLKDAAPLGLLLMAAMMPFQARAALGEPEATVTDDVQQLKGSIKSTQRPGYRVHEIQLPSGTVLREFASAGGNVFAVAWNGPSLPDLRQALGRYFDVYVSAQKTKRGGRGHSEVRQGGLVVQSNGHMRAFTGRAYVLQSIPLGTSVDELR